MEMRVILAHRYTHILTHTHTPHAHIHHITRTHLHMHIHAQFTFTLAHPTADFDEENFLGINRGT